MPKTGKRFQKTVEDFTCGNCGYKVQGSGFTNHCPKCLYSKHVDVNPGDRSAKCSGLMKPQSIERKNGDYVIIHVCQICGAIKKNRTWPQDDFDQIIKISTASQ